MTRRLTDDELAALGLDAARVGEPLVLTPDDELAEGATALAVLPLEEQAGQGRFVPLAVPGLDPAVVEVAQLDARPALLRLVAGGDDAELLGAAPDAQLQDTEDPRTRFVDTSRAGELLHFRTPSGEGVVIGPGEAGQLLVFPVSAAGRESESSRPPLDDWLAGSSDTWLVEEAGRRAGRDDAWQDWVAAGLVHRLHDDLGPADARALAEALASGQRPERLARVTDWAQSRTRTDIERASDLVAAEADLLAQQQLQLQSEDASRDEDWCEALRHFLTRRDDIECVWTLLRAWERGEGTELPGPARTTLQAFDDAARPFALSLPSDSLEPDERFARLAARVPEAWWVHPASRGAR